MNTGQAKVPKKPARLYTYGTRPRCPACGSLRLRSNGTRKNGDGSVTRYGWCQACFQELFIVLE